MEIHFQTTDHVVAVEKVAEQHIATKYSKCNSLRVISHIIILGKSAITHSKVGQSSPNPPKFEERKKSLGQVIYKKMCNCGSFRENSMTHARTHTHGANYNPPPVSQVGDNILKTVREQIFDPQGSTAVSCAKEKNFNFCHFWRPSWILAENKTMNISWKR